MSRRPQVRNGQKLNRSLSAGAWNDLMRMLDWWDKYKTRLSGGVSKASPIGPRGGIVQAVNDSDIDFSQFAVVGLDDILFGPTDNLSEFKNNFAFRAVVPTASHLVKFGILQEPLIADGRSLGAVQVNGLSLCQIYVNSEDDEYAAVLPGDPSQLNSTSDSGIPILYRQDLTGPNVWAVVAINRDRAGGDPVRPFQLTEKLSLGGRAKARKLITDSAGNWVMDGDEFEVNDFRLDADGTPTPGEFVGAVGYRGACSVRSNVFGVEEWEIINVEKIAEFITATLTEDMGYSTAGQSNAATVNTFFNGKSPGTTVNVFDPQALFKRSLSGAKVLCRRNDKTTEAGADAALPGGRYEIVEGQSIAGAVFFVLTADGSGTSERGVNATINAHYGTQQDVQQPTGITQVFFRGGEFPHALSGAIGEALYDNVNNKYWVIKCDQRSIRFKGSLTAKLNSTDSTGSVDSVSPLDGHPFSLTATITTVHNTQKHAGVSGANLKFEWDESAGQWEIYDVDKVEVTVQTNEQWDSSGKKIQTKTWKITVETAEVESGWTDSITFGPC